MKRITWLRYVSNHATFKSSCGRFTIHATHNDPKHAHEFPHRLVDGKTGKEYVRDSERSAKTAARAILNSE